MHVDLLIGAVAAAFPQMLYEIRIASVEYLKELPRKETRDTPEDKVQTQRGTKVRGATIYTPKQLIVMAAVLLSRPYR